MPSQLRTSSEIDLATVELDYEGFRQLALNPHLNEHERIGFPASYRQGFEDAIFADIIAKLPSLAAGTGLTVVDVGPGCAGLPRKLIELCKDRGHRLFLVDSEEMLSQLPDVEGTTVKFPGMFPRNSAELSETAGSVDLLLCYSVLHYIFVDTNLFEFVDAIAALLASGGRALIGDIPNVSKRRRFFASEAGRRYHKAFTGSDDAPIVDFNTVAHGKIDDAVLIGMIQRAQAAGLHGYLLPQAQNLPMANRRDDLLFAKD